MSAESDLLRQWLNGAFGFEQPPALAVGVECRKQSWGNVRQGGSIYHGQPLCLHGRRYEHGLGSHAHSEILVRLPGPGQRFRAVVGVDDNPDSRNNGTGRRIEFRIVSGGRDLWRSPAVGVLDSPVPCDVDLGGATEFTLFTREVHDIINYAHADWADAHVTLADGTRLWVGDSTADRRGRTGLPFSFLCAGQPAALARAWTRTDKPPAAVAAGTRRREVVWQEPATGLECALELDLFDAFPAAEWVLRLRNTGQRDTPIIEHILPLDLAWPVASEPVLHRSRGSTCGPHDFQCLSDPVRGDSALVMTPGQGRSSSEWLPFFNLQTGDAGIVVAVGWSGQWRAEFARTTEDTVRIRAGMERTRLILHPGETIRTPRILLLFWKGDPIRGHHLLRRFILEHHTPRVAGERLQAPACCATWGGMSTAAHLRRIETIRRERLPFDYYWVDAGWYGPPTADCANLGGDWSRHTGNWVVNPVPHPRGLRPVSDAAHAAGLKFLLWVETERAVAGTPVTREHPEWFLHAGGDARQAPDGDNLLLNLGHPEARGWALDLLSTLIHDIGMDGYRQDFNMEPLPCWQAADAADRQGLTEIRHIEGLYAFWDELLRRHPGLVIDNCASGGRRIDLETISRSVPLWRSDFQCFPGFDPTASQVHTSGLSRWVPLSATGTYVYPNDTYDARSGMAAGLVAIPFMYETDPLDPQYPWEWLRQRLREHQRIRPFHDGDFYPLTECTTSPESWMAYQLHRPDLDAGVLAVFRRPQSPYDAAHWPLRALEPGAAYAVEDQDSGRVARRDGSDLMATGVEVALPEPRSSRLIFYRRAAR